MSRWLRLTRAGGLAVGAAAAGAGAVIAAEKIAVGRLRLRPDPEADEPLGQLRGRPLIVLADDGVPLHAEVSGPDDAPVTIVFTHGFTLSLDCWHYQRQALEHSARLVFWDQRGHGRSTRLRPEPAEGRQREPVSIAQTGADLAAVLAATAPGDGPVLLVGHSMGGMSMMALAASQPELFGSRVIGTVFIATSASPVDPVGWVPAPLRPLVRQAAPPVLRTVSQGPQAALVERGRQAAGDLAFLSTRVMAFGDPNISPALVDFAERTIRATPVDVIAEFYLALAEHDQTAALAALGRAPSIVLTGDRDRVVPSRLAGELAAGIPGADLILVPGAGHLVILERPEVVTEAITELLARAAGRDDSEPRTA
jgi:pimeloyl-ACP methyl ester carboxylesterase